MDLRLGLILVLELIIATAARVGSKSPASFRGAPYESSNAHCLPIQPSLGDHVIRERPGPYLSGTGASLAVPDAFWSPLQLGRAMRPRLRTAVHALLTDTRLAGLSDAARLAAVVLLAKSPAHSSSVPSRLAELGRWLGCTASHVAHHVLRELRTAQVVTSRPLFDADGRVTGLELALVPLETSRAQRDHPLAGLNQRELATLLRLCEAVFGPGWEPRGRPAIPPGLIAFRRGRGAATDRLALLMLVLEARPDGHVRMVGGRVTKGRGRADATVARALGCSVSGGAKILHRLVRWGLVSLHRYKTGNRFGRSRLHVPAVASAHGNTPPPSDPSSTSRGPTTITRPFTTGPGRGGDQRPVGASSVQNRRQPPLPTPAVQAVLDTAADGAHVRKRPAATTLHTQHPPVVAPSTSADGHMSWFSGSAVPASHCLREPSHSHDDQTHSQAARALAPVALLWGMITRRSTRRWLLAAVEKELTRIRSLPSGLPPAQLLAQRLQRRLLAQGDTAVGDPVGWLLRRGLPQRPRCWSVECDEGLSMSTGDRCRACESLAEDARDVRHRIRAEVEHEMPDASRTQTRQAVEQRLRQEAREHAAVVRRRHDQARRESTLRAARLASQRQRRQAELREQAEAPCVDCGLPGAAGLCMRCTYRRAIDRLVCRAAEITVAARNDLAAGPDIVELVSAEECRIRSLLISGRAEADPSRIAPLTEVYAQWVAAQQVAEDSRQTALQRFADSDEADVRAQRARETALHSRRLTSTPAQAAEAAAKAAETARAEVARILLDRCLQRFAVLASAWVPRNSADWRRESGV